MITALLGVAVLGAMTLLQDPPPPPPQSAGAKPAEASKPAGYVAYPGYDVRSVFDVEDDRKSVSVDGRRLRAIVEALESHARNYPPVFHDASERKLAERDTAAASKVLATMVADKDKDCAPGLLLLAARVEAVGHNLDLSGATARADDYFGRILKQDAEHAEANLRYGMHLAGRPGRQRDALPLLEKAAKAGHDEALRGIGVCWLMLEDKPKALASLRAWAARNPGDAGTAQLIEAIESGAAIERVEQQAGDDKPGTKPAPQQPVAPLDGRRLCYELPMDTRQRARQHEKDKDLEQVLERAVRVVAARVGAEVVVRRRDATGLTVDVPPELVPQLAALRSRIESVGGLEFRIVADGDFADDAVRFDLRREKARLEQWLQLEGNEKLLLEDPRTIRRFNEDQAQGPVQNGNLAWFARKLRPDPLQPARWEVSWTSYPALQQATVKLWDDAQWNNGLVPAAIKARPAHEQFLVELVALNMKEVHFTGDDLDPDKLLVAPDAAGGVAVYYSVEAAKAGAYGDWSEKYIGKASAIVLDGLVVCAPTFVSRIPGVGAISGSFTRQEAEDIAAVLKAGALPVPPRLVAEEPLPASAFQRARAK